MLIFLSKYGKTVKHNQYGGQEQSLISVVFMMIGIKIWHNNKFTVVGRDFRTHAWFIFHTDLETILAKIVPWK